MFAAVDSQAPMHPVTAALAAISAALDAAADAPLWGVGDELRCEEEGPGLADGISTRG